MASELRWYVFLSLGWRFAVKASAPTLFMTNGRTVHKLPKANEWEKSKTLIETLDKLEERFAKIMNHN